MLSVGCSNNRCSGLCDHAIWVNLIQEDVILTEHAEESVFNVDWEKMLAELSSYDSLIYFLFAVFCKNLLLINSRLNLDFQFCI